MTPESLRFAYHKISLISEQKLNKCKKLWKLRVSDNKLRNVEDLANLLEFGEVGWNSADICKTPGILREKRTYFQKSGWLIEKSWELLKSNWDIVMKAGKYKQHYKMNLQIQTKLDQICSKKQQIYNKIQWRMLKSNLNFKFDALSRHRFAITNSNSSADFI